MNCPHCDWELQFLEEWVDADGFHGRFTCSSPSNRECDIKVTTGLWLAYDKKLIPQKLISETEQILQSMGMLATPP
jgi:thiol-disulfide isomerase/thioredoxin